MRLAFLIVTLVVLIIASIRRPFIGLLAMIAALQIEYFFMGLLPRGITLGRIAGLCAMIGWLMNRRKYRSSPMLVYPPLAVPSILFVFVLLTGALFAKDSGSAMMMAIRVVMLVLLGIMMGEMVCTRRDFIALCWVVVLSSAVGAGAALMQFGAYQEGGEVIGNVYNARLGVRFEGLTTSANGLGIQLLSGIPFLFFLFFTSRRGWVRLLCIGMLGMSAFVLVLTVSRSTLYPVAAYIAVSYVLHRKMGKHLIAENIMVSFGVLMLALALVQSSSYVWDRITRPITDLDSDTSFEGRMEIMHQGVKVMNLSPLFGVGLSNTRQYFLQKDAHDTISALVGETGLLGTLFFFLFCVAVVPRQIGLLKRACRTGDPYLQELAVSLLGIACILVVWLPVKVVFYQRLFWLWAGFVLWLDSRLPPAGARHPGVVNRGRVAGMPAAVGFPKIVGGGFGPQRRGSGHA